MVRIARIQALYNWELWADFLIKSSTTILKVALELFFVEHI